MNIKKLVLSGLLVFGLFVGVLNVFPISVSASIFNYSLSATNVSLLQGGTGQSTVLATLTASGGTKSCSPIESEDLGNGQAWYFLNCESVQIGYWNHLPVIEAPESFLLYAGQICGGSSSYTVTSPYTLQNGGTFTCTNIAQPVNLTLSQILDASGNNVLGKTDGTGIQFDNFNPSTITPTASSILTIHADDSVPAGTYIGTVVSNTAQSALFNIIVANSYQPPTNLTASLGACSGPDTVKPIILSWTASASASVIGYNIYRNSVFVTSTASNVTTYQDTTTTAGISYSYSVKAAFVGTESVAVTTAAIIAQLCTPPTYSCTGTLPLSNATICPNDNTDLTSSIDWIASGNNSSTCTPTRKCEYYWTDGIPPGGNLTGTCTQDPSTATILNGQSSVSVSRTLSDVYGGSGGYSYKWSDSSTYTTFLSHLFNFTSATPIGSPSPLSVTIKDSSGATVNISCGSVAVTNNNVVLTLFIGPNSLADASGSNLPITQGDGFKLRWNVNVANPVADCTTSVSPLSPAVAFTNFNSGNNYVQNNATGITAKTTVSGSQTSTLSGTYTLRISCLTASPPVSDASVILQVGSSVEVPF